MSSCIGRLPNFEFGKDEIEEAQKNGQLLSMEIEFSLLCDFKCPYCYAASASELKKELSTDEQRDVILQAKALGVKRIIILGGEPMIYPHIFEMIDFISEEGLEIQLFTNGSNMTLENAKRLFAKKVNVVLKMNTFDKKIQDELSGFDGAYEIIQDAYLNLHHAGYPSENPFLAICTIICKQNIEEIVDLWKWARDRNIVPYIEMITPQGSASQNEWLYVPTSEVQTLFETIQKLDYENYGQVWESQPPLIGNKCMRHHFSCLVTSKGDVLPCVGVTLSLGNVRNRALKDILDDSEVLANLRNHTKTIKGPCRTCDRLDDCYGCRGAAYQLTGDYLASDPLCWHNIDKKEDIVTLPMPVKKLIPQKGAMRMIDTLLMVGERVAEVSLTVNANMPFIDDSDRLDGAVFVELIAQAAASMNGFFSFDGDAQATVDHKGFLIGAKKIEIFKDVFVGDYLKVRVEKKEKYGDFGVIHGVISRSSEVVAQGEITVWHTIEDVKEDGAV